MSSAKIKVLFQLNELALGGTTKSILSFCKYLDRERFEPFLFFHSNHGSFKYWRKKFEALFSERARKKFDEAYVRSLTRLPEFETLLGKDHIFSGQFEDFKKAVEQTQPDIVHFNRGEAKDWYTERLGELSTTAVFVETNIFGVQPSEAYFSKISRSLFVSQWLKQRFPWAGDKGGVLYCPILAPQSDDNLRQEFNIPAEALVLGRITRPFLDEGDFVIDVFKQLKHPNVHLIVAAATGQLLAEAQTNPRLHALPPTSHERRLSKFYRSLDLLLHYRIEGETFGMNIAEAMIHGVPVISHFSAVDNAQVELLEGRGWVAKLGDKADYLRILEEIIPNSELRAEVGAQARSAAVDLFEASRVTRELEKVYTGVLNKNDRPSR